MEKYCKKSKVEIIGHSVLNKNIYAVLKQNVSCGKWALITGGIHAREHLSTDLICLLIKDFEKQTHRFNVAFVPLINPDGAELCTNGIKNLDHLLAKKLITINGNDNFSLYKANANGVDLNNNWEANWDKRFSNKTSPSSSGFYGNQPMSEPEVVALKQFTKTINPFLTINFHLKGEEIYFDFFQSEKEYARDQKIAKIFANATGYKIVNTQNSSSGGYKDWCVQKLKIPSLTIELGNDKFHHPFPKSQLKQIYKKNKNTFNCIEESLQIFENNFN